LQRMRKQGSMEQRAVVIPARSAATKHVWRPKQVVSWVESKFMADKAIIALRSKNMSDELLIVIFSQFWSLWCFLTRKLYQKTGDIYIFAPKIGRSCPTGQTCGSHKSDCCGQRS
jgi:hypothetical protein